MLYRLGWKGLVIDANAQMRPLYRFFRARDTFVHTGVGRHTGINTYYKFSDGAYNTFSDKEAQIYKDASYPTFIGTEQVSIRTLADILETQQIKHIDVLSIDVEGLDIDVLMSHDWNTPPKIILIEDNNFDAENPTACGAYKFLHTRGYKLTANTGRTLFFVRQNPK
jgi:FkbM family methyltransferase